ncbi:MAG: hypothetical protein R2741_11565 [Methanolobus sp.]
MPRLKVLSAVSSIDRDKLVHIVNNTISEKLEGHNVDFEHNHSHEHDHDHAHPKPINLINNN